MSNTLFHPCFGIRFNLLTRRPSLNASWLRTHWRINYMKPSGRSRPWDANKVGNVTRQGCVAMIATNQWSRKSQRVEVETQYFGEENYCKCCTFMGFGWWHSRHGNASSTMYKNFNSNFHTHKSNQATNLKAKYLQINPRILLPSQSY